MKRIISPALWLACLCCVTATAQKPANKPSKSPDVERIAGEVYRVGKVTVDIPARKVTCRGVINQDRGEIEYLAVAPGGKLHESLLRLDVRPIHLQLALMMTGLEPVNNLKYQGDSAMPAGPRVHITMTWRDSQGTEHSLAAQDLILSGGKRPFGGADPWSFTGSRISREAGFLADTERSLIAVWRDPAAIIDNGGTDGAFNNHVVAPACPKVGTPVEIVISSSVPRPASGKP